MANVSFFYFARFFLDTGFYECTAEMLKFLPNQRRQQMVLMNEQPILSTLMMSHDSEPPN